MRVVIPGPPVGRARPRFATGNGVHVYMPDPHEAWKKGAATRMADAWRQAALSGPIAVMVEQVMQSPKRIPKGRRGCPAKPDLDNVVNLALDALVLARVIADDRLVVRIEATKRYTTAGEQPHVVVVVEAG